MRRRADLCVALDCDGVLLDSNRMKSDAFASALSVYPPDVIACFLDYQRTAFGLSRYRLVDRFFVDFLRRPADVGEREGVLDRFGNFCREAYPRQALTTGVREAIGVLRDIVGALAVVSGSDETELQAVMRVHGIGDAFMAILGSPATKEANLATLASQLPEGCSIVFVGDASADWSASVAVDCRFVYMSTWAADPATMAALSSVHGFPEIAALGELPELLRTLAPRMEGTAHASW